MLSSRGCYLLRFPRRTFVLNNPHLQKLYCSNEAKLGDSKGKSENPGNGKKETNSNEAELQKLKDEMAGLTEKYQRSLAETENIRMSLRKEITDAKQFGIQTFCKDLLTVADVLQMAISSIPKDLVGKDSTEGLWKSFFKGVSQIDKELQQVFERRGLVVMEPQKGEKFDPNNHESMFKTPVEGMEAGLVVFVQRNGYKLNGRTLRAAQVGISGKSL